MLGGGLQAVRTTLRALALRQMDQGQSTPAVGANLGLSAKAVWKIGKRYLEGGLDQALFDAPRPGKTPALDQQQQQHIIAVVCSPPPEGRARWTVRLLTQEVIKRKLVPKVGRETIRVLLESHDLKLMQKFRPATGCGNDALWKALSGLPTELGNHFAIPTFPQPRLLLHSLSNPIQKGIPSLALPSPFRLISGLEKGVLHDDNVLFRVANRRAHNFRAI